MKSNNNNSNKSNNYINKLNKVFKNNRKTITIVFCALVLVGIIFWGVNNKYNILTSINKKNKDSKTYTSDEVKYIKLQSDNYGSQGTWSISNTGDWKSIDTAYSTLTLSSIPKFAPGRATDVVFVVDTSSSAGVPNNFIETTRLFLEETDNKAALISFNTKAKLETDFTNSPTVMENAIRNVQRGEMTNFYLAYKELYNLLKTYNHQDDRDLIVIVLTDGLPTVDSPNEVPIYNAIKSEFPYVTIDAVLSSGSGSREAIKRISDHQYSNDYLNLRSLLGRNILYDRIVVTYDINDDNFDIKSNKDIHVSKGTVTVLEDDEDKKIVWTLSNISPAENITMNLKVNLKSDYIKQEGLYPLTDSINVFTKFENEEGTTKSTSNSIKLEKKAYNVSLFTNRPLGCLVSDSSESYFPYEMVSLKKDDMKCSGYLFAGWKEITDTGIDFSGTSFKMPTKNVVLNGSWSKPDISKRMDGTINESSYPLYDAVRDDYTAGTAKKYTGVVKDTMDDAGNSDIYYYEKSADKNENNKVLFANFCWNIVRTTKTGGVKLQAAGVPTSSGSCNIDSKGAYPIKYSTWFDDDPYGYMNIGRTGAIQEGQAYSKPSVAFSGYMYNKIYEVYAQPLEEDVLASSEINYSNGTYTLVNPELTTSLTKKYTCYSATETSCEKIRYYFTTNFKYLGSRRTKGYVVLENTPNIETAYDEMMYGDNLNTYDSPLKKLVDNWYQHYLSTYSDYLEDVIHCIDRYPLNSEYEEKLKKYILGQVDDIDFNSITNRPSYEIYYKPVELVCNNILSSYSMNNSKAKLTYPVSASVSIDEHNLTKAAINRVGLYGDDGEFYGRWESFLTEYDLGVLNFTKNSIIAYPTISLKPGVEFTHGNGSMDDPYVIK